MKTTTYNNVWMSIGITNSRGRYVIESNCPDLKVYTTDSMLYDAFCSEDEERNEPAHKAAYDMLVEACRDWVLYGVATYNADPFKIEGEAVDDVVRSVLEYGAHKIDPDEDICAMLDIDECDASDYKFYKTGDNCLLAVC